MKVAKKCAVAIDYKLSLQDGTVVDSSEKGNPLWYLHGAGNIIVGLEAALEGLAKGNSTRVTVKPEDGYGTYEPKRIHVVDRREMSDDDLRVGERIIATSPDGTEIPARITAMDAKTVTLDFNHELAGQVLTFDVTVAELRDATGEELRHGHVHGPGAHHH